MSSLYTIFQHYYLAQSHSKIAELVANLSYVSIEFSRWRIYLIPHGIRMSFFVWFRWWLLFHLDCICEHLVLAMSISLSSSFHRRRRCHHTLDKTWWQSDSKLNLLSYPNVSFYLRDHPFHKEPWEFSYRCVSLKAAKYNYHPSNSYTYANQRYSIGSSRSWLRCLFRCMRFQC